MGLLDEAEAEAAGKQVGPTCSVRLMLESMEQEFRVEAEELLMSDYAHSVVAQVLENHGYDIGAKNIGRHRARVKGTGGDGCRCPRG